MIATGGGDGAIRLWMLENDVENIRKEHHLVSNIPQQQKESNSKTSEETPRMIGLLQDASVLIMTDQGLVLLPMVFFCFPEEILLDPESVPYLILIDPT